MAATMNCPYCGKLTDPRLDACPHCGVPLRAKPPAPRGASAAPRANAPGGNQCKNCRAPVRDGDIICSRCGVNLLTGEKIAAEQAGSRGPSARWVIGSLLALVLVVALVAAAAYYVLRDPVAQARQVARAGNVLEAINILNAHISRQQNDAEAHKTLGQLYWDTKDYSSAAESFATAATLNPDDVDLGLMAAVSASRLTGEIARVLQVDALKRLAERHPDNARVRYLYALVLGSTGDAAAEVAELEALLDTPNGAAYRDDLGVAQALTGDLDTARATLESAQPGGNTDAAQGFVASLLGDDAGAQEELISALEQGSNIQALAGARLGMLLMSQGRFEEALPRLRDAKNSDPPVAIAEFFHALALQANGLNTEALQAFDRIALGKGEYSDDAAVQMALLFLDQGDLSRAQESLRKATAAGGDSAKLATIQGKVYLAQGDQAQAQQSFRLAISRDADYAPAYLENGLLFVARGMMSDGLEELRHYLDMIGPDAQGVRYAEIEMLVNQLQQTVDGASAVQGAVAVASDAL